MDAKKFEKRLNQLDIRKYVRKVIPQPDNSVAKGIRLAEAGWSGADADLAARRITLGVPFDNLEGPTGLVINFTTDMVEETDTYMKWDSSPIFLNLEDMLKDLWEGLDVPEEWDWGNLGWALGDELYEGLLLRQALANEGVSGLLHAIIQSKRLRDLASQHNDGTELLSSANEGDPHGAQ